MLTRSMTLARVSGITFLDLLYQATLWHWQSGETMMQTFSVRVTWEAMSEHTFSYTICDDPIFSSPSNMTMLRNRGCSFLNEQVLHLSCAQLLASDTVWPHVFFVLLLSFMSQMCWLWVLPSTEPLSNKQVNDLRRLVSVSSLLFFFFLEYDEMSAIIRSFHSSTSLDGATPPRPSCPFPFPHHIEPNHVGWEGLLYWVCGHGGGGLVQWGTQRTFLWMSEAPFFFFAFCIVLSRLKLTSFLFLVSISVWSVLLCQWSMGI
jgi:hypothetical protein